MYWMPRAINAWIGVMVNGIAQSVAQGQSTRDIAAALFLSPRTVEHHLYRIFPKLGVTSRGQLGTVLNTVG